MSGRFVSLPALAAFVSAAAVQAQPLPERVLLVYNPSDAESADVAAHYRSARGIPSANLCSVNPPPLPTLSQEQFESSIRAPVRTCLNTVGRGKILYLVLAYLTPQRLIVSDRLFATDSALADIWDETAADFMSGPDAPPKAHGYYAEAQTMGNIYPPFVSLASWRASSGAKTIYSVFRLDGPTPAIAKNLVTKAMQAESGGLSGIGCFDRRFGGIDLQPDSGYQAADWDLARAAAFVREAGYTVVEDTNGAEFGTVPAPARCDSAALYSGWYSFGQYPDAFSWNPGAIGFHLDSASAANVRSGTNFTARALLAGITVTGGAVNEPYLEGLVRADGFFRNLLEGAPVGDAMLRNLPWLKWMNVTVGDPLYTPFPDGRPPFSTPRRQDGLSLQPRDLLGGMFVNGTVYLSAPAPAGGAVVALSSSSSQLAPVQSTVTVAAGAASAGFRIATTRPASDANVRIEATYGGVVRRNSLYLAPLLAPLTVPFPTMAGAGSQQARVNLNGKAPPGGVTVALASNHAALTAPAAVFIPEGQVSALFMVSSAAVTTAVSATLTATEGLTKRVATVRINPVALNACSLAPTTVAGGLANVTGTVTLNGGAGAGGFPVTLASNSPAALVPASVIVPAGTNSVPFTITTKQVAARTSVAISCSASGVTRLPALTIQPDFSLRLVANPVMGGGTASLVIATAGLGVVPDGLSVSLTSGNPNVAQVPASAAIPGGAPSVTIPIGTKPVGSNTTVRITVTSAAGPRTIDLVVVPAVISAYPNVPVSIPGGSTATGSFYLTAVTQAGVTLRLSSSNSAVGVPATLLIPAGRSGAAYPITTPRVTSSVTFTVTAVGPANSVTTKVVTITP